MQDRTPTRPIVPDFNPVPRQRNRHDGWTPERQRAFLEALADTGSVRLAARTVNMASEGAYQLRRQPGAEEFAAAWNAALDHGIRRLEDIALERAIHGVEVPVYSYGKLVGSRIVHNDRLLMLMLRNRSADRFAAGASGKRLDQWQREGKDRPGSDEVRAEIQRRLAELRERTKNELERGERVMVDARDYAEFEKWKRAQDGDDSEMTRSG